MFQASDLHERCLQVQPWTIFEISVAILCPQRQFKSISYVDSLGQFFQQENALNVIFYHKKTAL